MSFFAYLRGSASPTWRFFGGSRADEPSWHFIPLVTVMSPYTGAEGAQHSPYAALLEKEHLRQEDNSQIAKLWSLWPDDEDDMLWRIYKSQLARHP